MRAELPMVKNDFMKPNVLAAELWAEGPSAPVPLRRDSPAAGVEHAALRRERACSRSSSASWRAKRSGAARGWAALYVLASAVASDFGKQQGV